MDNTNPDRWVEGQSGKVPGKLEVHFRKDIRTDGEYEYQISRGSRVLGHVYFHPAEDVGWVCQPVDNCPALAGESLSKIMTLVFCPEKSKQDVEEYLEKENGDKKDDEEKTDHDYRTARSNPTGEPSPKNSARDQHPAVEDV